MITPTIHLNGTSARELCDQLQAAGQALSDAMAALRNATPNGRDYYPQSPDAIKTALREHESRLLKVQEVKDEIFTIFESVIDKL